MFKLINIEKVMQGAWVHAPPPMKTENQWIGNVFFFPVFLRRRCISQSPAKQPNNTNSF
jgi:hypothetical protein